ncbi:MAG: SEC-C metal-binding domain-containing protein [Bradyrhizobium sp.]
MSARQLAVFSTHGGVSCARTANTKTSPAFSVTRKRRKSFPSETHVKRGRRVVHGDVELIEKLGRNDLCPCGSGRRFQDLLHEIRRL